MSSPLSSSSNVPNHKAAASTPKASAAASSSSPSLSEVVTLAPILHVVATLHGDQPHLKPEERQTTHHREAALSPRFPSVHAQQKFVDVLQALVTLCAAEPGENNIAAMVALSNQEIKLFICQNGGRPFRDIKQHLQTVWRVLHQLHALVSLPDTEPSNLVTPPRVANPSELELSRNLLTIAHLFVAKKAVHRAKKRLPLLEKLLSHVVSEPSTTDFQRRLVLLLVAIADSASEVFKKGFNNLEERQDWKEYRGHTRLLYNLTIDDTYVENMDDVEILQVIAESLGFNLKETIEKAVKVQAAALTLNRFAVSPHRGWITGLDLRVQPVPLPATTSIDVQLDEFDSWCPPTIVLGEFHSDLRKRAATSTNETITINSNIHSECELVARVIDNTTTGVLAGFDLIHYVCCSKLHCHFCHLWLENLNKVRDTNVAFDGSHGGVKPGWLPPTWETPLYGQTLAGMRSQLEQELGTQGHGRAVPSTSSDPSTSMVEPSTDVDEQRFAMKTEQLLARKLRNIHLYEY
ncbi:hypothetical protein B0H17DRAFT_1054393 [Mycena rosella]|uniref:Uncharacterized protein n=1 Tax=Mycena rosella TaxID=1033263 RepID=A0AAD7GL27_MYCRO|nr:hypothetical protein B0H17DRAFT_1054393 [Mycena rosella]